MFNNKKIQELERELAEKNEEIEALKSGDKYLREMQSVTEAILYIFSDLIQDEYHDVLGKLDKNDILDMACKARMATAYNSKKSLESVKEIKQYFIDEIFPKVYKDDLEDMKKEWESIFKTYKNGDYN